MSLTFTSSRSKVGVSIMDRNIKKEKGEVNAIADLERRLSDIGYSVGIRLLELTFYRDRYNKREIRLLPMLQFIGGPLWKALFGKPSDSLEKSIEHEDEYMIIDNQNLVNKYISTPREFSGLNCAAFVAGIVEGILDGAEFTAKVTAHSVDAGVPGCPKTVLLVKFDLEVIEREKRLAS